MNENQTVIVTPIEQKDYDQWLPYWQSYQEFYEVELLDEVTETTWSRFFNSEIPVYFALAMENERNLCFSQYFFNDYTKLHFFLT